MVQCLVVQVPPNPALVRGAMFVFSAQHSPDLGSIFYFLLVSPFP